MAAPPRIPQKPGLAAPPPAAETAIAKSAREKDELETEAAHIEEELEELKARYEQYFLGIERKEPSRWREELKKRVLRVKEAFTRNTGLKFRIQSLHARFLSYERLWLRSAKEKEEGTYRRDLFKARLHAKKEPAAPPPGKLPDERPGAAAKPGAPAPAVAKPAGTPVPASAAPPPLPGAARTASARPPPSPGAMSEAQLRALYDSYVAAKRSCNEDTSRISYDAVANTVSRQIPEIMSRYKAKSVEFKVEVRDGKAVLKAIPKV